MGTGVIVPVAGEILRFFQVVGHEKGHNSYEGVNLIGSQ